MLYLYTMCVSDARGTTEVNRFIHVSSKEERRRSRHSRRSECTRQSVIGYTVLRSDVSQQCISLDMIPCARPESYYRQRTGVRAIVTAVYFPHNTTNAFSKPLATYEHLNVV